MGEINKGNRLQFVHCDQFFATREEAIKYVNGDTIYINRPALYAEPMILKYGEDETNPNILLAIGSVGDGVTQSTNNRVFFIDVKELQEDIKDLNDRVDAWTDTSLESGYYDNTTESIVLTLSNGEEVYVEVTDLIEEWGVEENAVSPIMLSKTHVVYEEGATSHEEAQYRDILSADVRISENPKNILVKEVVNGLESLYVDGSASNIKCWIDGEETTVQDALASNLVKVSESNGNIITKRNDGLFATVDLLYDKATHTLTFSDGVNEDKVYKLNAAAILNYATYEKGNLVLDFNYTDGTRDQVLVPISEIIKDFELDNTNHTVNLVRVSDSESGQWRLSADVNVSTLSDNILEVTSNELYVKGTADNIKYNETTSVEGVITTLTSDIANLYEVSEVLREDVDNAHDKIDALTNISDNHDARLDVIEGGIDVDGSVKKALADAKDYTNIEIGKVNDEITSILNDIEDEFDVVREEILTSVNAIKTTAGLGLKLQDNQYSLNLNEDTESYLVLTEEGLAIKGVNEALAFKASLVEVDEKVADAVATMESRLTAVEDRIDGALTDTLTEAKTYTDEKLAVAKEDAVNMSKAYVNEQIEEVSFTTENTSTVDVALVQTESGKKLNANVKIDLSDTNILRVTENGIGAIANLTYDPITSKLTFNNGIDYREYNLAANSLVSDAKYDENGNLVLVITKEDGTTEDIKVTLEKIEGGNDGNSPITVHVSDTLEGVRRITATLSVSNNTNNLIIAEDGSLFASKVASDHIGTYRDTEMTMQEALGKIAEEIDEAAKTGGSGSVDVTALQAQINTLQGQVTTLTNQLSAETSARQTLENRVLALEAIVTKLDAITFADFGTYGNVTEDDNTEEGGLEEDTPNE